MVNKRTRVEFKKNQYQLGKANNSGLPYNPVSHNYENTMQGNALRKRDNQKKVQALTRAQNLEERSNCGFNVLTG